MSRRGSWARERAPPIIQLRDAIAYFFVCYLFNLENFLSRASRPSVSKKIQGAAHAEDIGKPRTSHYRKLHLQARSGRRSVGVRVCEAKGQCDHQRICTLTANLRRECPPQVEQNQPISCQQVRCPINYPTSLFAASIDRMAIAAAHPLELASSRVRDEGALVAGVYRHLALVLANVERHAQKRLSISIELANSRFTSMG